MPKPDTIDIHQLLVELNTRYGRAIGYQMVWSRAIADRIPATRVRHRGSFKRADVPTIAKVLGLTDPPAAA